MKKKWILFIFILLFFIGGPVGAADEETVGTPEDMRGENNSEPANIDEASTGGDGAEGIGADAETVSATASTTSDEPETASSEVETPEHGFGHKLLFYIPNRFIDVFDFIRLRVRVGPGFAAGVRATRLLTLSAGGYSSVYAGLPGPRLKPIIKLPFGIENYTGLEASVLDASNKGRFAPGYSITEIGASVHLILVGIDVTVDPVEVLDLVLGFLFIDIRGDDL